MITYRIKNWAKHFENSKSRQIDSLSWVPVPNKHDGEGFRTIITESDGLVLYGCWHLILQVASKCHPRGTLVREDGTPHTAKSIAIKTGCGNPAAIQRTLDFCSSLEVGWIELLTKEVTPKCPSSDTQVTPPCPRTEGNGTEGNGTHTEGASDPFAIFIGAGEKPEGAISKDEIRTYAGAVKFLRRHKSFRKISDMAIETALKGLRGFQQDWPAMLKQFLVDWIEQDIPEPTKKLRIHCENYAQRKNISPHHS